MKIKLLNDTKCPTKGRESDIGYDLYLNKDIKIKPRQNIVIDSGVCVQIPQNYAGKLILRSSICKNTKLILKDALIDMSKTFHKTVRKSKIDEKAKYLKTQQILPIKEAIFKKFKTIKTVKSLNKISAQIIVTVPPCVPIVMPGEIVSREAIDLLLFHKIYFIDVVDD